MRKLIVFFTFISIAFSAFSINLNSIIRTLPSLPDSNQVDSVFNIARLKIINAEAKEGIQLAKWALQKARQKNYRDLIPKARFYIAYGFKKLNIEDSCIYHYELALIEMKGTKHEDWAPFVYTNIVNFYRNKGKYQKALSAGFEALKLAESKKDTIQEGLFSTEVGYIYDRMKEFEKAIEWHRKALKKLENKNEPYQINFIRSRIGIAYDDLGQFDSAHFYNQISLRYSYLIQDSTGIASTSSNIGNTFIKQEKWDSALVYLLSANQILKIKGDDGFRANAKINLGNVLMHLGRYEESKNRFFEGLKFAKKWGGVKFESEAFFHLHELYKKQNQLDSALFYFILFKNSEDSLYRIEKLKQIEEISTKYESKKKEQQIEIQQAVLSEQESEIMAKQRAIFALGILVLLAIVLAFAAYKRYQAKKNSEVQFRIIEEQEKGLYAVFNAQEEERKRISKDLHDGVGQQLSGLKMAIQTYGNSIDKSNTAEKKVVEKLAEIASDSANEVRSISHQMMPKALTELGLIEAMQDMLEKSFDLSQIQYEFEHFGITGRLNEKVEISLYRVAQELVNNIIKHSDAKRVNVQLFKNSGKVIMVVEDDGKGMSRSKSDGHGLLNMKSRINTLHGEMNLEPSPNSGTLATIRIPLE